MNQQTRFKQTEIGKIPEDWEVKSLKLICDKITDGSHFSPKEDSQGNYKIATVKDMSFLGFDLNSCKKISEEDYNTLVKTGCKVEKGHVLFSKDGTMGIVYVPKVSLDLVLLSSIAILKPKKEIIPEFLGYYLKGKKTQWIIQSSYASGSALPRIVLKDLKKLPVVIPPNTEQKSISKILSDLDSKIELNHQMNKTLEAIAQALFKHWFVDFEFPDEEGKPYKSSGGEMVDSEMGEIPKGWGVRKLGDYIQFIKGRKPKSVSDNCFKGYLQQILIDTFNGGKPNYANPEKMVIVETTEPIMVMDGASSGRMEIGYSGIVGSTLSKVIVTDPTITNPYLFYFLKRKEAEINQNTTGTSIPHTDKERIKDYSFAIPDEDLLSKFDDLANQLLNKIMHNKKERKALSKIRDTLLPKLMSGQIRVKVPEMEVN